MINSKLSLRRSEADAGASLKCYHSERHLVAYSPTTYYFSYQTFEVKCLMTAKTDNAA